MSERERYCPECGAAHQAWATRCADCECALVDEPPPPRAEAAVAALPPAHELACVRAGDTWHVRELAEALQEAGISCRIDSFPPGAPLSGPGLSMRRPAAPTREVTRLGVYVLPADQEAALRLERELALERMPGAEDAPGHGHTAEGCPACGTPLPPTAESCAECGLEFPPLEEL